MNMSEHNFWSRVIMTFIAAIALLGMVLSFTSCRACYTKPVYEKELLQNDRYHYIELKTKE